MVLGDGDNQEWIEPAVSAQGQYLVNLLDFPAREHREEYVCWNTPTSTDSDAPEPDDAEQGETSSSSED
eukprot:8826458-Prorocentrum_lima.AAC.1